MVPAELIVFTLYYYLVYLVYLHIIISVIQPPKVPPAVKYSDKFISVIILLLVYKSKNGYKHSLSCSQL